jgi:ubiquinone/menaquinone biosynthesis C-methylase UbiE
MKVRINDISAILKCPESGADINIADDKAVSSKGTIFNISDGIIDLTRGEQTETQNNTAKSYDKVSEAGYDRFVSSPLIMKCLWGVSLNKAYAIYDKLYDYPDGIFLDVPCGTGLFSSQLYLSKPDSTFIAVDYSMGMLKAAKNRCRQSDIRNVVFVRADVANLPFKMNSFDACFSINGFHVFPDPVKAAYEIAAVLKKNAVMAVIAASSGERWFSDLIIKKVMLPKGLFNSKLPVSAYKAMFEAAGFGVTTETMGAMMYANCRKL